MLFEEDDSVWSRNIKRGIISVLQTRSYESLRRYTAEPMDEEMTQNRGSLVNEFDVLGKCRTVYTTNSRDVESPASFEIRKKKTMHTCSLNSQLFDKSSLVKHDYLSPYQVK